ncbi:hypothetical protein GCM10023189_26210 [Nibrella saemangeumensis]|uniref:LTD domain-containing protein n=1 Tax=Nibrella saemangeumensis TaxID=1084526 RepID=A0ABP8MV51_9BACT
MQSYTLTGSNLDDNPVSVSATKGIELSTNGNTFAATPLSLSPASGSLSQVVYARLAGSVAVGPFSGTITNASNSTLTAAVIVSGTVNSPTSVTQGSVVISQVYGGGGNSGATYKNDFIELYNRTNAPISLAGWSVQYTSSAGTTWQVTPLTGTIPAGGYYLIQQAAGSGGTADLPTPDATGSIPMAAGAGKVALVKITTALSGSCDTGADVIDFVGYGSAANCSETAPTATLSNTTAAIRKNDGATDTDNNASDFTVGSPNPRNSAPPAPALTVTPANLTGANSLTYIAGTGPVSKTISVSGTNLDQASGTITVSSSNTAITVSTSSIPFSNSALSATTIAVQLAGGLEAGVYSGTITLAGGGATQSVPVTGLVTSNTDTYMPIAIARAAIGQTFTIAGRVTVTNQLGARQIYIQDNTGGIVVYSGPAGTDLTTQVELGDSVQVRGPISVFNGFTEITNTQGFTVVSGVPNRVPTPKAITLDQLASYQGQLVSVSDANITPEGATFTGNSNYNITAGGQSGTLRINANSPLVGAGRPSNPVSVTGIADRFVSGSTAPGSTGLQLQPRILADIPGSTPAQDQICSIPASTTLTRDQTLDIATWNMEFFGADAGVINCPTGPLPYNDMGPVNENLQQTNGTAVLNKLNADIIAVQEMSDVSRLQAAVAAMPGSYSYICSDRFSYYFQDECTQVPSGNPPTVFGPTSLAQKVCVIYNTATVTPLLAETQALLDGAYNYPTGNGWSSGRLPFLFVADATIDGITKRIHVVNIHAKSGSATSDYDRRKQDILDLKAVLDANYPNANLILLGDYNDKLNGSIATGKVSTYEPFVSDVTGYSALTTPLENQGCSTFNSSSSFIDHMIVSNDLARAYVTNTAYVLQPLSIPNYANTTSDHNPVVARFDLSLLPTSLTLVASATPATICSNATASLSVSVSGGVAPYTYDWTGTGTLTNSNSATATVSGLTAGPQTFTVVVTDAISQTATVTTSVMVQAQPDAPLYTSQSVVLTQYSGTITLDATGCEGGHISWVGSDNTSGTNSITVTTSTTGTIVYTSLCTVGGCISDPVSVTVTINAGPLQMLTPVYDCTTRQLTIRTIGGNGNPIDYQIENIRQSSPVFTLSRKDLRKTLTLKAMQLNSAGINKGYDQVVTLDFTPQPCPSTRVGAEEVASDLSVTVLGNPVQGEHVEVEVRGAVGKSLRLTVTDLSGRLVTEKQIDVATETERQSLSVGKQATGLLLLQVSTPTQRKTLKLLKQ